MDILHSLVWKVLEGIELGPKRPKMPLEVVTEPLMSNCPVAHSEKIDTPSVSVFFDCTWSRVKHGFVAIEQN